MTKDDIIRMAREAGFLGYESRAEKVNKFAALVAAPLQERIQLLYEQLNEAEKQLDQQYQMGVEAEREACAKVVENYCGAWSDEGYALAAAIRARGNA
jgi:aspartate ammonia-lyase